MFASGASIGRGRWHAAVRDFALAAGRFTVARRTIRVPAPVVVTVAVDSKSAILPQVYLDVARSRTQDLVRPLRAYPWKNYTVIVESTQRSLGQEYPTIVFLSDDLPLFVTVHETAHHGSTHSSATTRRATRGWTSRSRSGRRRD